MMVRFGLALVALLFAAVAAPRAGAEPASRWFETDHGKVRLIAGVTATGDLDAVPLGLEFQMAPGWKIYWRSPGDAGYPPAIDWTGSGNLERAAIAWPAPMRFSLFGLDTVGYEKAVVLPIEARPARKGEALALKAAVDYLTCAEICVPYQAELTLDLPAGPAAATPHAAEIQRWQARVPAGQESARIDGAAVIPGRAPLLELKVTAATPVASPDAFVEGPEGSAFGKPQMKRIDDTHVKLRLPITGAAERLVGTPLTVTVVDGPRLVEARVTPVAGVPESDLAMLLPILGFALLGGFILNFMPCVLPVLSMKLAGLIGHAGRERRLVRAGFLATSAGIVFSFVFLGAVLAALKAAGVAVGWGLQFQQPAFLAVMTALLLLFAANLWGAFEVPLPGWLASVGGSGGKGLAGSFATGAFATLLATPCSAPFLGTAIGFALAGGPSEIIGVFVILGFGLALPYLAVASFPGVAALLPRPGRWMLHLRRVLGVLLLGTALWLGWVLAAQLAPGGAAVEAGPWRPFDRDAIERLVGEGKVVLVDVTADWCLTCKVNERLVLESRSVAERLGKPGIVAMRADWTRPDPRITAYLRSFGRYGIPFNAVYGPGLPNGEALPELLTVDEVLKALGRAEGARKPSERAIAGG